jgi:hypothetical protein
MRKLASRSKLQANDTHMNLMLWLRDCMALEMDFQKLRSASLLCPENG